MVPHPALGAPVVVIVVVHVHTSLVGATSTYLGYEPVARIKDRTNCEGTWATDGEGGYINRGRPYRPRPMARYPVLMDCPQCKKPGAYTGLLWVHCVNEACDYFDARYAAKVKTERITLLGKAERLISVRKQINLGL